MVTVHCRKCGARYETALPVSGVLRVGRCKVCNRIALEIDDEAQPIPDEGQPEPHDSERA